MTPTRNARCFGGLSIGPQIAVVSRGVISAPRGKSSSWRLPLATRSFKSGCGGTARCPARHVTAAVADTWHCRISILREHAASPIPVRPGAPNNFQHVAPALRARRAWSTLPEPTHAVGIFDLIAPAIGGSRAGLGRWRSQTRAQRGQQIASGHAPGRLRRVGHRASEHRSPQAGAMPLACSGRRG